MADARLFLWRGWQPVLALFLCMLTTACGAGTALDVFFAPPPDIGARLPVNGIFPQGRTLAFMGYSGNPARDLTNGFTVAGPVYGNQADYLERCVSNHWPVVAHVGLRVNFLDPQSAAKLPDVSALRREIQKQVGSLADHPEIVCGR